LLHDLGLILIDQYLHGPFCRVVDALTEEASVCEVEMRILGFDHTVLGAFLGGEWSLPEHLNAAIRHHHGPEQYEGPDREMVCVVAIANLLCHLKGLSSLGVCDRQMPQAELFAELGLQKEQVSWVLAQLDETLAAADVMAVVQMR
jgi:HD-like signal output (HDOD) protein